ncbi:hypothetical protein F7725_010829 [Dissostichus mawsoni]|uniref:Uncharacterized protein n=1 Tax=Dissostichus mawsoni TaxID=36200 RepID=A0A7J5ZB72_DISMA|nr:hypothetical protein F7725_010829 [Dissostichus mawsoni]
MEAALNAVEELVDDLQYETEGLTVEEKKLQARLASISRSQLDEEQEIQKWPTQRTTSNNKSGRTAPRHQTTADSVERTANEALIDSKKSLALIRDLMTRENKVQELIGDMKTM